MIKTMFLAPVRDNEGRFFDQADWDELHERLYHIAQGFRRVQGGEGRWRHDGVNYEEPVWQYEVSLDYWRDLPAWIDLIRWVRERFRQISMYTEVMGVPEYF